MWITHTRLFDPAGLWRKFPDEGSVLVVQA